MRQFVKFFIPIIIVGILIGTSCKKSTTTTTTNYMTGSLAFTLPGYILVSSELNLNVTGITVPTTGVTYKWVTTGFSIDSIIGQSGKIYAPATYGDYSITVSASCTDYTTSTNTLSTIVIDPSNTGSFSGVVYGPKFITDSRDGKKYYYSTIGTLDWFSSNLNWAGAGKPYNNIDALTYIFGRLYSWTEATGGVTASTLGGGPKGACPTGWSVPTKADWENLAKTLNGNTDIAFDSNWPNLGGKLTVKAILNDKNLWKYSPNNQQQNLYNWNAMAGGSVSDNLSRFSNINQYGFWWSSTERDASNGEYRYIYFDSPDFPYNFASKNYFGASVRCVRMVTL